MNYLAHAYLSFSNPKILVGNMIADYVRGKQIDTFDNEIQNGIRLHRLIDEFTDKHPIVKETKLVFRKSAMRYDGSFLDIAFDHYLALDTAREPNEGWLCFTKNCYNTIDLYADTLPPDFNGFYKHLKTENWLYNYRYNWLIKKNFNRFANHLKYLPQHDHSDIYDAFEDNYTIIKNAFEAFFPQLEQFAKEKFNEQTNLSK